MGDCSLFLTALHNSVHDGAIVICSVANPLWEPILLVAEKFGLKMPEGPHNRPPLRTMYTLFEQQGFTIIEKGFYLPIPKPLWGADLGNKLLASIPLIRRLGFIVYWVLKK